MPRVAPFEAHTDRYEAWFETHEETYRAELAALDRLLSAPGRGLEIGVGSGRFATPLGIDVGLDPAPSMLHRARDRGVEVVRGVAEALPYPDATFDTVLLVTTVCFVEDLQTALAEAERVLTADGTLLVGFVDRESPLGRQYRDRNADNPFYRDATFVGTDELVAALETAGFSEFSFAQTLFEDDDGPGPVEEGHGEGSFVAIEARR